MAQQDAPTEQLEGQTYEIIRKRLTSAGDDLRARLAKLNDARRDVFGSIETELLGTERITTENNCVPRDMVALGDRMLFGYNVHVGLRSETVLADVFAVYRYADDAFEEQPLDLIGNAQFEKDFADLYKYYRDTRFAKFSLLGPHLFMVFRVGAGVADVKTFKWAIDGDRLHYIDNRSDQEFRYPPQHDFDWKTATREQQRSGVHPHLSIDDRVFVEAVGGDLTIKIEDNTASGQGIYAEPVDEPDQTLDDGDYQYAILGNIILLKIRPYQEKEYRHIVFNEKIGQARRLDAVADACILLPDDHGLIFSNGYYLQTGEYKTFETSLSEMKYAGQIRSSNGEDFLYVFYNRMVGTYVLLSYNLISQEVATPTVCNGFALFDSGRALTFRHHDEPQRHHAIQIWQTPYVGEGHIPAAQTDSLLFKIGNRDLVRAMAECHGVLNLLAKEDTYGDLYLDLVKKTTDIVDAYFWIDKEETYQLRNALVDIRDTASGAISEFEKVQRVKKNTAEETARVTDRVRLAESTIRAETFDDIAAYVRSLAELRAVRGEIISLRDLRYVDGTVVDTLEEEVREHAEDLAVRCVEFLLQPESLKPYDEKVAAEEKAIGNVATVVDAKEIETRIGDAADELEMLIEIVSNLKIEDATQRTAIIENISTIFSRLNQTRAKLKSRTRDLMAAEGAAEFHSQLKLLDQAVVNYLDICDTAERCEEYLTKVMIQIEEMEGRFAEFDEFIEQIGEKRDEIYNAFEARRLALVEAKNRRAATLMKSAERILKGCQNRVENFETVAEINGYFASDLMVEKVRDIVTELGELGDSVKVDDIQSRLKTIKEDAVRQLKDRQELYVDGQNIIQFGRHKFSVNVQALDLTMVVRDGEMNYHLTGTNFFQPVDDEQLNAAREAWDQEVVSETPSVYRAEYLAYLILESLGQGGSPTLDALLAMSDEELLAHVQKYMGPRYSEGYIKGVHDHDASIILRAAAELKATIGLLRYRPPARAVAELFWQQWSGGPRKKLLAARLKGFGTISGLFPETTTQAECIGQCRDLIGSFLAENPVAPESLADEAGEYLFHVLARDEGFTISPEAAEIVRHLHNHLEAKAYGGPFAASLENVSSDRVAAFLLARDWVRAYLEEHEDAEGDAEKVIDEAALRLLDAEFDESRVIHVAVHRELTGLVGTHPVIASGAYHFHYNEFAARLARFANHDVPRFVNFTHRKHELVDTFREELKLEEFRPRVLTSFVRNQLIDKVYLPLVGDNFAKQLGSAGESKRTDRMGLLLLISPPGYGKTTLMEYIANRLGIVFMKINGPAIGHQVTSLDPVEAPNASAREEVEKLNLSLEMGDNVMIYLDDIQHCHPEFLQKFISLCDAQRKIEGVYKGRTRTYDLRGRKVCVVMAGNPYTESGEKFQIPDMLANRADTYNLGEIIGDNRDVFEMSYLENSLTSNPTLSKLASRSPKDIYSIFAMAATGETDPVDLEGNYSLDELEELIAVTKKLMEVRDIVLGVNREYIRSAAQSDDYRTEPPFRLQGSYRNMNRIAERVSPIMNDRELAVSIYSSYENDAQTLTTGAEANLLKFKELTGTLTDIETKRWADIKRTFQQNVRLRGIGSDDKFGQVIAQMGVFSDGLHAIKDTLAASDGAEKFTQLATRLDAIRDALAAHADVAPPALQATFAPDAMAALTKLAGEIRVAAERADHAPGDQKIHITNKLPRTVLAVIREQFKLMENWMKPLVETTNAQTAGMAQLRHQLDEALKGYQTLLREIEPVE